MSNNQNPFGDMSPQDICASVGNLYLKLSYTQHQLDAALQQLSQLNEKNRQLEIMLKKYNLKTTVMNDEGSDPKSA